jgi:hypothetical protein
MKVYVHYDSSGAVHSLVAVNTPEGSSAMLTPRPGLFVAELDGEVEGLKLKPDARELEALRDMVKELRVPTSPPRCTLVRRDSRP